MASDSLNLYFMLHVDFIRGRHMLSFQLVLRKMPVRKNTRIKMSLRVMHICQIRVSITLIGEFLGQVEKNELFTVEFL